MGLPLSHTPAESAAEPHRSAHAGALVRLSLLILAAASVGELGVMFVLPLILPPATPALVEALCDAGLLILVCAAALSPVVLRFQHRAERAEAALVDRAAAAEAALSETQAFRAALEAHSILAITDTAGVITDVNDRFCQVSGYTREELIGKTHRIINSGMQPKSLWVEAWRTIASGKTFRGEVCNRAKDGSLYWVDAAIVPFKDRKGKINKYVAIRTDITARKNAEEELRRMALLDRLTGLPNRGLLLDRLSQCIRRAERNPGRCFAVLFLDFDRFKLINDSLGHEAGDELLRQISARLRAVLHPADTLARDSEGCTAGRLGGDEFVVILDELGTPKDAITVANRLLETFQGVYRIADHEVVSTASIGIVTSDLARGTAEDLLRDADTAMYEAKLAGKGRYVVFNTAMRERVQGRLTLETDLRRAVSSGELWVAYQPIVALEDGATVGMEALVRWNHPVRGAVPPGEFIGVAEETGLIIEIGAWVLRQACERMAEWRRAFPRTAPATVSVNISRAQLAMADLPEQVMEILRQTGLPPAALRLEVTENQVVGGRTDMVPALRRIKAVGISLAMDDFGTGLSSLSGLHQLPFDVIKIDRSFVANISTGRHFMALAQSVVSLAGNLGLKTVAEGIESQEQVAALQGLGCDYGQGYFFARPITPEQMTEYLRARDEPLSKAA